MNDQLLNLNRAAKASIRGESIEPRWLYETALRLSRDYSVDESNRDFLRTILVSAKALSDVGEYAFAGEIFELMLQRARDTNCRKTEFQSLEGLAISRFFMGDKTSAFETLNLGIELAIRIKRTMMIEKFESLIADLKSGNPAFPKNIKAPSASKGARTKQRAHASTLLKKRT